EAGGELVEVRLSQTERARVEEAGHDRRVPLGPMAEGRAGRGGRQVRDVDVVLDGERQAVERQGLAGVAPALERTGLAEAALAVALALVLGLIPEGAHRGQAMAGPPLTIGFVYVGPKTDYGYNQAHAEGAAAIAKLPGVKIREEEMVPETMAVQKTMESMI